MKGEFIMGNKYDQAYEDFLKMFDREPKMDPNLNYNGILMEDQFLTIDIPEDTYIRMNELKKDPPKIRDNFIATLCTFHREIYGENAGQLRKKNFDALDIGRGYVVRFESYKNIATECNKLFKEIKMQPLEKLDFNQQVEKITDFFSELWRIHPFEKGNEEVIVFYGCEYFKTRGINLSLDHFMNNMGRLWRGLAFNNGEVLRFEVKSPVLLRNLIKENMLIAKEQNNERTVLSLKDYKNYINNAKLNKNENTHKEKSWDNIKNKNNDTMNR